MDAFPGLGALVTTSDFAMIANLSWRKGPWIATDVRPENALVAEADGIIRAIDFIIGKAE
jgi:hypothetical protein